MLSEPLAAKVEAAVDSGCEALFARLRPDGVFDPGGDRFSPANTAAALIALHHADAADADRQTPADRAETVDRGVRRLLNSQRPDGGWAMDGVPTELLATAAATAALRLTAPERAASAVRAGSALVTRLGGAEALGEPAMTGLVRQFDALSGVGDLASLPRLPIEALLLRGPARRLLSLRLPIFASMALAQAAHRPPSPLLAPLRAPARREALRVVRDAYEREGATGELSTDPWLTSLISLGVTRSALAPDISRASARALRAMARTDGGWDLMPLDVTWSSFATAALLEAGHAADPRLAAPRAMFHERQQDEPFAALGCPPGYWGFSSARSWPMALETAEVSSALLHMPGGADDERARRGVEWLNSLQDPSGSWSLAVRGSKPGGFGPCPHMTAKAVRTLLDHGVSPQDRRVVRALGWLTRTQLPDGSYEALWYRGRTAGTAVVLETFCRAGRGTDPAARRARERLLRTQREDGSWSTPPGEDPASSTVNASADEPAPADDSSGRSPGESPDGPPGTVEETAWALHALLTAGADPRGAAVAGAARWLADSQCADGSWRGAPVNEYVRFCSRYADDGIASGLAVRALARLRSALTSADPVRAGGTQTTNDGDGGEEAGRA
ncbi:prenyltransferase/squalene oxidase repeat-containing protein [Streptomyces nanshensis]|uniref:prenyltransferase/squalene oxidase repeat-containing protein n=1 Tax=Streptomyces nanshensis TaxID=518642 RepID=UPI00085BB077|nr:prenyltransferase/squalene oxidase repeat-containing protein [Streptomyces nanshensis]